MKKSANGFEKPGALEKLLKMTLKGGQESFAKGVKISFKCFEKDTKKYLESFAN